MLSRWLSWRVFGLLALGPLLTMQFMAADNTAAEPPAAETQPAETQPAEGGDADGDAGKGTAEAEQDADRASRFIRISKTDAGQPEALETSIIRYEAPQGSEHAGLVVDLVGVVHIGEKEYYEELDKRLKTYDVVLYELVAPDGTRVLPEEIDSSRSPLGAVQLGMRDMLNLQFQLQHIDYMAKNFRHADMSPEQFIEDMESRGDSVFKMGLRMMGAGLASQSATAGDAGMMMALLSGKDRPKRMKQIMARQLTEMEAVTAGIDDAQGENTLIKGRNVRAFEVLDEEIDSGKKRIAVFYGAGHLPDMADRLEKDFQLQPSTIEWFEAWDLQRN